MMPGLARDFYFKGSFLMEISVMLFSSTDKHVFVRFVCRSLITEEAFLCLF